MFNSIILSKSLRVILGLAFAFFWGCQSDPIAIPNMGGKSNSIIVRPDFPSGISVNKASGTTPILASVSSVRITPFRLVNGSPIAATSFDAEIVNGAFNLNINSLPVQNREEFDYFEFTLNEPGNTSLKINLFQVNGQDITPNVVLKVDSIGYRFAYQFDFESNNPVGNSIPITNSIGNVLYSARQVQYDQMQILASGDVTVSFNAGQNVAVKPTVLRNAGGVAIGFVPCLGLSDTTNSRWMSYTVSGASLPRLTILGRTPVDNRFWLSTDQNGVHSVLAPGFISTPAAPLITFNQVSNNTLIVTLRRLNNPQSSVTERGGLSYGINSTPGSITSYRQFESRDTLNFVINANPGDSIQVLGASADVNSQLAFTTSGYRMRLLTAQVPIASPLSVAITGPGGVALNNIPQGVTPITIGGRQFGNNVTDTLSAGTYSIQAIPFVDQLGDSLVPDRVSGSQGLSITGVTINPVTRVLTGQMVKTNASQSVNFEYVRTNQAPPPSQLGAVTGLTANVMGNNVSLTWNPVSGALSYDILLTPQNGSPVSGTSNINAFNFSNLPAGVHSVAVNARNQNSVGPSATVSFTINTQQSANADSVVCYYIDSNNNGVWDQESEAVQWYLSSNLRVNNYTSADVFLPDMPDSSTLPNWQILFTNGHGYTSTVRTDGFFDPHPGSWTLPSRGYHLGIYRGNRASYLDPTLTTVSKIGCIALSQNSRRGFIPSAPLRLNTPR